MNSKEYLQEIRKMNDDINEKKMDLHELKIMSKSIHAINNGEKVQSSPNFDKIGTWIAKIDELEREIERMKDVFGDRKNEAVDFIMLLDKPRDRDLIFRKYILFEKNKKISQDYGIKERAVKKAHKIALERLDEKAQNIV